MSRYQVEVSAVIEGPAGLVYQTFRDYHEGHPAVLPPRYFTGVKILEGGLGAGTVVEVAMNVFGSKQLYRLTLSEPEPGRVLVEEDAEAGVITTFTVEPLDRGVRTLVTISTSARTSPGLRGLIERLLNPPITRRIYREELQLLNDHVQARQVAPAQ